MLQHISMLLYVLYHATLLWKAKDAEIKAKDAEISAKNIALEQIQASYNDLKEKVFWVL